MGYEMLLEMRKFVAPEIIFGLGALDLAGEYAKKLGANHILLVSDHGVQEAGWTYRVESSLKGEGLNVTTFNEVTPNPREEEVMQGAALYKEQGCDAIVSVGGGSPMDCAKGIGVVVAQGGHILDYEGVDRISVPIPPLICLPTTAGTGAEVSQFCIITDQKRRVKIAIVSKATVPDVALIDPEPTTTMDSHLTACTGLDALVHAFEAYVSNTSSPLTDRHALAAIGMLNENLLTAIESPKDMATRGKVALASLEAGLAFSNAILGAVHAMAHSLGGLLDLPHGECNAILLEHVVKYNFPEAEERYRDVTQALGVKTGGLNSEDLLQALLDRLRELRTAVGVTSTLGQLGVKTEDLDALSQSAHADACLITNPREALPVDLKGIYEEAL
jgi:alcohol dehydrogenase